jgi:hypothetical protein
MTANVIQANKPKTAVNGAAFGEGDIERVLFPLQGNVIFTRKLESYGPHVCSHRASFGVVTA